ncbi:serine/threonine-protein kinase [Prosthecobacter sp.]|uniref:serine/threonine-protein kinase n=1 Tax=Prosthecobacter sp. TaxID=1965333 RepID=UPI001D8DCF57|nr:serine/threonine-protein kinase [Prosthecobacter sp.]MCB1278055.1 serine/threonine protein kinase [Prosthecobacter sp.]
MSAPESRHDDIAPLLRLGLEEELPAPDPEQTLLLPDPPPPGSDSKKSKSGRRRWSAPAIEELQRILPNYEITTLVACGGMGAVYKGTQVTLKRGVAIKVLPPDISNDEDDGMEFANRFKREAQAMARLSHPNIVTVFDAGQTPGGLLYYVMEFIDGTDVAQLIASEGRVAKERAVEIITAVCDALAYAHAEGIVHRDIKPSNVMIDRRGTVKVADFGLAKALNRETTALTRTQVAMGTPDYMAPEATIPGIQVDGRADIYAVGVMLYQMLTGKVPRGRFEAASGVVPKLDRRFDAIVDKAMQTDREKRYSTAIEMKGAIERATTAAKMTSWRPTSSFAGPAHRSRVKTKLVIAAVAVIALGFVIDRQMTRQPQVTVAEASTNAPPDSADPTDIGWHHLIPLINPEKNALSGRWKVENGELVYLNRGNDNRGAMEIPVDYNGGSYDLRIRFTRADTIHQSMSFSFRKGTVGGSVLFDVTTPSGLHMAGLEYDRDTTMMNFNDQWPKREQDWLTVGQRHTLLLQVRDEGLRAELNGQEVFRWMGDWSRLQQGRGLDTYLGELDHLPIFGLGLILGSVTYHNIEMKSVAGAEGVKLPAFTSPREKSSPGLATVKPADPSAWTNLLENFDPVSNASNGLWSLKDGELFFDPTSGNVGSCDLPVDYDGGNYELRIQLTRPEKAAGGIAFAIRKGKNGGTIIFDQHFVGHENLKYAGLSHIADRPDFDLGDLCPPRIRWMAPDSRHTLLIQVRDEGLRVVLDDQEAFRWVGDWSHLKQGRGADVFFTRSAGRSPIFGLASKMGGALFHRIEFRKVTGEEGKKLEPAAPSAASQ